LGHCDSGQAIGGILFGALLRLLFAACFTVVVAGGAAFAQQNHGGFDAVAAQAIALRGLCAFEAADFPQSLADLQQSIALGVTDDPSSAALIRLREAQLLTRVGRFEESLAVYGLLVNAGPSTRETIIGLGLAGLRNPQLPSDMLAAQQDLCAMVC
jgi:tetratricopeptide (TPR) repeat protein